MTIGSRNLRVIQASELSGAPPEPSGNSSRTTVSTGLLSTAASRLAFSNEQGWQQAFPLRVTVHEVWRRATIPVDPSCSRLTSSDRIRSGCRPDTCCSPDGQLFQQFLLVCDAYVDCDICQVQKICNFSWRSNTVPTLVRGAQSVADAGFGQDVLWPLGVRLDFLANLTHINSQILSVGQIIP